MEANIMKWYEEYISEKKVREQQGEYIYDECYDLAYHKPQLFDLVHGKDAREQMLIEGEKMSRALKEYNEKKRLRSN